MNDSHGIERRFLLGGLAGAAGVSALAAMARGGPLNPPAGTVASTGRTLTEIEPRKAISLVNTPGDTDSLYRINSPGSYYLTDNILVGAGKSGIEVASSGVTIDLNGFYVAGLGGDKGITTTSTTLERVVIRNGRVRLLTFGISLGDVQGVVVEGVCVEACGQTGISVGPNSVLRDCVALGNGSSGLFCGASSVVSCCVAADNDENGMYAGNGSSFHECTASGNGTGINLGGRSIGIGCAAHGNVTGIIVGSGAAVNCSAADNTVGVSVSSGRVSGCSVSSNLQDGIQSLGSSVIEDNVVAANGGTTRAGIYLLAGTGSRVLRNSCRGNGVGIKVALSTGNFIGGNTCRGNTLNWDIAAGNVCFVVQAATTAAFSGDSGGTSPGSSSPWTNYTY